MRRLVTLVLAVSVVPVTACGDDSDPDTSRQGFIAWATEQGGVDESEAQCIADELLPDLTDDEIAALVSIDQGTSEAEVSAAPADEFVAASTSCALDG